MLNQNENEERKEFDPEHSNFQLKYNNPEGDSTIGFRYSKYRERNSKAADAVNYEELEIKRGSGSFWKQTGLMTWKNYLVFSRNLRASIFQLLVPIALCLLLLLMQAIVDNFSEEFVNKNPEIFSLNKIDKCIYPEDCTTIGYGIISSRNTTYDYIESIMQTVAQANDLEFNKDVKLLTIGDSNAYSDYLEANQNKTKYGVVFCLEEINLFDVSIPCTFDSLNQTFHLYTLIYNLTMISSSSPGSAIQPFPVDFQLTRLKQDMDNAYMKYYAQERGLNFTPTINATVQSYPMTHSRLLAKADVVSTSGAFFLFFPPMLTFVFILLEIIREKDSKLRKSLLIIGLNNGSFWFSWFIVSVVYSIAISLVLVLTGIICGFGVFTNAPFLISFFLYFIFSLTMQFLGYFLTTILKSINSAYTVSYTFILVGLVMEIFLSNYTIIYNLYSTNLPWWVDIVKFAFSLYPPFNFSKAFSDIANKAASHLDNYELRWVEGPGYKWEDLFVRINGKMFGNVEYDVPSTAETMGYFLLDIFIFSLLAWYFDHVDSSNRGKSYGYFFFLEANYWCPGKRGEKKNNKAGIDRVNTKIDQFRETLLDGKTESVNNISSSYDPDETREIGFSSVLEEKLKILKSEEEGKKFEGLRILGCFKNYLISYGCCRTRQVRALKKTFLEIPNGELFTILGHNGAGKSTLINILTGNSSPTGGTAKINDSDIILDPFTIEEFIGLCPQHDILWEELTAREHIELYAHLRNFPNEYILGLIESKLNDVNLILQADSEVRTYSGGMKRRLSILLSTLGQPKVIFLDEPTTGLDPVNKRFIWSMIQKLKKNKSVILTTHSMEEADFLSDRIGVIVEGKFKCVGTPFDLKKLFGGAYLLTFICDRDNKEKVQEKIKAIMPSSVLLDNSGGSIILNLPFDKVNEMRYFISILNHRYDDPELKPLEGLIKECGMNYTTLEEIFLKITSRRNNRSSFKNKSK